MTETPRIGLIGAGIMGKGLGRNMLHKGFPVAVHDSDRAAVDRLVGMGATAANGIAGIAQGADIVVTCLPSLAAISAVYDGPDGVIANARLGTIAVDTSTSDPKLTQALGAKAAARGVHLVDAPMLRMEPQAWEGTLVLLVGGAKDQVERCRPMFEAVSEQWVHCGPLGAGHTFKLLNNMVGLTAHVAYCESFTLAKKLGLDLDLLFQVLKSGMSNSRIMETMGPRVLANDLSPMFATEVALKDIGLFTRLAESEKCPALAGDAARQTFQLATAMGHGGDNITAIGAALARLAGVAPGR
ncbi:MAG: NAD(P)-dependent oxidoreductase [Alphaproteobacteria bacterium]|nr:NAD(P)-dependent oxidoreductase [Alphaproteobacteria bacterium]